MKIILFGGGGFIGSWICDELLRHYHEVIVFEKENNVPYRFFTNTEKIRWHFGSIVSESELCEAIQGADAVYHLLSTTTPQSANEDPCYDVETNLIFSIKLLNAMVKSGIKKLIFISSGGTIYGLPQHLPINENHAPQPRNSYGITKLSIENYILMYRDLYELKPIILRVSNPFGPRQNFMNGQGVVGSFLDKAYRNEKIEIWGDGTTIRDFLYIEDLVDATVLSLYYSGRHSIFNIASGIGISINQLLDEIESTLKIKLERCYQKGRDFDIPINILDNSLAKKVLRWKQPRPFKEGLMRTIEILKINEYI